MNAPAPAKRFLVAGASGLLGSALLPHLTSLGHAVVGTRSATKKEGLVAFDLRTDRVADRLPPAFRKEARGAFGVVCASICQIDRCRREREVSRDVNVDKTIRLIDDLVGLGIKPVFISSGFVFDGREGGYREGDARHPICEYGRHKAEVEAYLEKNVPRALTLRFDKVVGDDPSSAHLLSEWHDAIRAGKTIACIAGQVFCPTLVADLARAIERACELDLSGLYHVANPEAFAREELARRFASALGAKAEIVSRPLESFGFDDPRPLKTTLDSTKFIRATDCRFTPMKEVFRDFVEKTRKVRA